MDVSKMRDLGRTIFLGDLADRWIAAIAAALPAGSTIRACPDRLPEEALPPAETLFLHRSALTDADRRRLDAWRAGPDGPGRVLLIVGPHVRHHQLEAWSPLVEAVLYEATAAETIGRHVAEPRADESGRRGPTVTVVGGDFDLSAVLVELVRLSGYPVRHRRDWPEDAAGPVLWDVPLLDPRWPEILAARARSATIVAVMDLPRREDVILAREAGATACLDSTCEFEDLAHVLDRIAANQASRPTSGWRVDRAANPPAPHGVQKASTPANASTRKTRD